jgi:beta-phosphoglucomutase-like phosphatase (HAD superfamily)
MIKGCVFNLVDVILKQSASEEKTNIDPKLITPDYLMDGFLVFLKELKNKGILIAVVSKEPALKEILDRLRITHLSNNYFTGNIVEILKTTSNIYENAATSLQLIPNEILVFVSSEASEDIILLKNFNLVCVGSKLIENPTVHHITDFSSLKFNQLITSVENISQN